jgi:hypothetical protein
VRTRQGEQGAARADVGMERRRAGGGAGEQGCGAVVTRGAPDRGGGMQARGGARHAGPFGWGALGSVDRSVGWVGPLGLGDGPLFCHLG